MKLKVLFNFFLISMVNVGNTIAMDAIKSCCMKNHPLVCLATGNEYGEEDKEFETGAPIACCYYPTKKAQDRTELDHDCQTVYCGKSVRIEEMTSLIPESKKHHQIHWDYPTCCQRHGCFCNCQRARTGCERQICFSDDYQGIDLLELVTCFCCGNCLDETGRFIPSVGATVCFNSHCRCLLCMCDDRGCSGPCVADFEECCNGCGECDFSQSCLPCGGCCCKPSRWYTGGQVQSCDNTLCCAAIVLALKYGGLGALSSL